MVGPLRFILGRIQKPFLVKKSEDFEDDDELFENYFRETQVYWHKNQFVYNKTCNVSEGVLFIRRLTRNADDIIAEVCLAFLPLVF